MHDIVTGPTPSPYTPDEQQEIDQAMLVVTTIDNLANNPDFRTFMQRFSDEADGIADKILHTEMPAEEREKLRQRRIGMLEILLAPKVDRDAQLRTLARYGIKP